MDRLAFKNDLGILPLPRYIKWKMAYNKADKGNLHSWGTVVFCGPQGSGKTLSAVQYAEKVFSFSPRAILVTNVDLNAYMDEDNNIRYIGTNVIITEKYINEHWQDKDYVKPVVQYQGLDMFTTLSNVKTA